MMKKKYKQNVLSLCMSSSYYDILGVSDKSTDVEIKKAYRSMSLRHHPDRGGDAEKFKEVSEAYETLSDSNKRREYDMDKSGGERMYFPNTGGLDSLFQNFFNGGGFQQGGRGGIHVFHSAAANHPLFSHFVKPQSIHVNIHIESKLNHDISC